MIVTHNAGFFSCCSIRLEQIVQFFNDHGYTLPTVVDSSAQFRWYKPSPQTGDITFEYFRHYDDDDQASSSTLLFPTRSIDMYRHHNQYRDYTTIPYGTLRPFIQKYFSLADPIMDLVSRLEIKYDLVYTDLCVLFYRGNDKARETRLCEYKEIAQHARTIIGHHPNCRILLQSDETDFIESMLAEFGERAFFFKDEIRHMPRNPATTVDKTMRENISFYSKYYLAITYVMSKCKWIVCTSGNCSLFIMYYRGNANNVYQFLNGTWICPSS